MSATPSSAVSATPAPAAPGTLRRNLSLWHAVIISVGVMSPAASIFFNTIPQAQYVGAAIPLCYVIGFVVALLVAHPYSELSREMASSGSAYTFVTEGIGPRWGFLTGWIGIIAIALGAPYTFVLMSANLETVVYRWLGVNLHWSFYFVLATGIVFGLCYLGVRESLRVDLVFLTFELIVCAALAAIVLLHVGQQGNLTAAPFTPAPVPANGILPIGIVLAVLSFIGFETAATLGEETRDPHRNIPRAVFGALIVVGVFYIVMAYVGVVGYGPAHMVTGYGNDAAPFDTVARRFGGAPLALLIDLAGIISFFAAALAIVNGGSRILFAVARDGLLPRPLAWTHPRRHTPGVAITLLCLIGLVVGISLGLALAPINAFTFLGTLDALFIILIYILVNIACFRFFLRKRRAKFGVVRHGVLPWLGVALTTIIFAAAFVSPFIPPIVPSLTYIPFVVVAWLALGLIAMFALRKQLRAQPIVESSGPPIELRAETSAVTSTDTPTHTSTGEATP